MDAAYLCAQKSTTIMIGMLEDAVAKETEKHKMPYIHSQIQKHLFILCAQAWSILSFYYYFFVCVCGVKHFYPPFCAPCLLSDTSYSLLTRARISLFLAYKLLETSPSCNLSLHLRAIVGSFSLFHTGLTECI